MKHKENEDVIYPEFLTCIAPEEDVFWTTIFNDLSKGICPSGAFFYKEAYIGCRQRGKMRSIGFRDRTNEILHDDVVHLFNTCLNMRDDADTPLGDGAQALRVDIKKKAMRIQLLEMFTVNARDTEGLSTASSKELLNELYVRVAFKFISTADITYLGGRIVEIEGLRIRDGAFEFSKSISDLLAMPENKMKQGGPTGGKCLGDIWKKLQS